jgi:hypothetical protein
MHSVLNERHIQMMVELQNVPVSYKIVAAFYPQRSIIYALIQYMSLFLVLKYILLHREIAVVCRNGEVVWSH